MLPYESHLAAFMIENLLNCVSDIVERNSIYEMNMISINLIGKAVLKDPSDIKNSQERQDGGWRCWMGITEEERQGCDKIHTIFSVIKPLEFMLNSQTKIR